ncbi:MAG TPA: hypothetical protein VF411_09905 [Bacteroidia bacterium]
MNTFFTYRILTYTHSQLLAEKLNVGILFYFKNPNRFVFKYPKTFKRIREIYNGFSEWQLKTNLRAIEEKTSQYINNNLLFIDTKTEEEITNEILRNDATVLSFSEEKIINGIDGDIDLIIDKFYKLYFSDYKIEFKKEKHDEIYLIKRFKQQLFLKNEQAQNLLFPDIQIKTEKTTVKFDYKWKNGLDNLVKPISFDLEEENSINIKAIQLHGQLNFISEKLKNNKVDLLISSPISNNIKLQKAYKVAISILNEIEVNKSIVEEKGLERYTQKVAETIHP